jgi:MoxR-like ATPase
MTATTIKAKAGSNGMSEQGEASGVQAKFVKTRLEMDAALIERGTEVDIVLTGLLSGHHPLLVGEPGTAKSLLGRTVAEWLQGRQYEILLNKFSDPMELFGPISVEGLKKDEYRRITEGTLVDAEVAFLDEIFKASTAILNATLGVLNERRYRNGRNVVQCPLLMAVAASNEWPQDDGHGGRELGALFDRFLLRRTVMPVRSPEGEDRLLWDADLTPKLTTAITAAEIMQARAEALAVPFKDDAKEAVSEILRQLAQEGIFPGDRRKRWSVGACRAFAYLSGSQAVERDHLEILAHCLWVDPREQPIKTGTVVSKVANPVGLEVSAHLAEVREILGSVQKGDLETTLAAVKKLGNVGGKLKALGGNSRVVAALGYVNDKIKALRLQAVTDGTI